ncbi:hypothetical protein SKAU_G00144820 [Synaphobranchus kaupii]|uniref:Uncharacterized protein n=1 Tax=Synaphobranchus kaupii TaxID=118154 RepID=A0A9Q1FSV3_SYNKA|nr:hypothetical protein SKAU_G00144820 [Synaphobranchus kaupii]
MAHAASQLKKKADLDLTAAEEEKDKKKKIRKRSRELKKKQGLLFFFFFPNIRCAARPLIAVAALFSPAPVFDGAPRSKIHGDGFLPFVCSKEGNGEKENVAGVGVAVDNGENEAERCILNGSLLALRQRPPTAITSTLMRDSAVEASAAGERPFADDNDDEEKALPANDVAFRIGKPLLDLKHCAEQKRIQTTTAFPAHALKGVLMQGRWEPDCVVNARQTSLRKYPGLSVSPPQCLQRSFQYCSDPKRSPLCASDYTVYLRLSQRRLAGDKQRSSTLLPSTDSSFEDSFIFLISTTEGSGGTAASRCRSVGDPWARRPSPAPAAACDGCAGNGPSATRSEAHLSQSALQSRGRSLGRDSGRRTPRIPEDVLKVKGRRVMEALGRALSIIHVELDFSGESVMIYPPHPSQLMQRAKRPWLPSIRSRPTPLCVLLSWANGEREHDWHNSPSSISHHPSDKVVHCHGEELTVQGLHGL